MDDELKSELEILERELLKSEPPPPPEPEPQPAPMDRRPPKGSDQGPG